MKEMQGERGARRSLPDSEGGHTPELSFRYPVLALRQPHAATVVRLRALVNRLLALDDPSRSRLAVVGAESGVGRSFVASNLAVLFAQAGSRTLLIDADFRNASLHVMFGVDDAPGFCDAIAAPADVALAAVRPIPELEGLSLLPAGAARGNAAELYGWRRLGECLDLYDARFDRIVIDCPSALDEGEAQAVAARAGTALLVTRARSSKLSEVRRFVEGLRATGVTMVGGILNGS